MSPILVTVAGAPVPKGRPRIGSVNGRPTAFTPAHTRKYEAHARLAAQDAMDGREPLDGPVEVRVVARLPIPRSWSRKRRRMAEDGEIRPAKRPDLDNMVKSATDACNGIAYLDDRQIVSLRARKEYAAAPGLEILVTGLETAS